MFREGSDVQDDGLNELVEALPPSFTSRFGEICWAAGGNGFGWWPSVVYDPRLTVGIARSLARKNLGKRHLGKVYVLLLFLFDNIISNLHIPVTTWC